MKNIKKILFSIFLCLIIVLAALFVWIRNQRVVPILMFHEVALEEQHELNVISPENFEKLMNYLKSHNYHVISLNELVSAIKEHKSVSSKSVAITFDDGYENNYTLAFPILKKYQFPATIFVVSGLINTPNFLSSSQINEMIQSGLIEIGSHTKNHVYLPLYPNFEKVKDEIKDSKVELEKLFGIRVRYFCYPSGGFTKEIKNLVKEAGYEGACTTNRGYNPNNRDVFALKRIRLNNKDYDFSLMMKLSGYYTLLKKTRNSY